MNDSNELVSMAEKEAIYHKRDGEGVALYYGGYTATAAFVEYRVVRVCMRSGVFVTTQNELGVRAVMRHLDAWRYKAASFLISDENEVVVYCDRDTQSPEGLSGMLSHVMYALEDGKGFLEAAAQGASPKEAIAIGSGLSEKETDVCKD